MKGEIVLIDQDISAVQRIIPLQYNPDTLTRTFQVQGKAQNAATALKRCASYAANRDN